MIQKPMAKSQFVTALAEKMGTQKKEATEALDPITRIISTGEGHAPFDTAKKWRPEFRSEVKLGAQATGHVRAMMPGLVCIIGRGIGGYG